MSISHPNGFHASRTSLFSPENCESITTHRNTNKIRRHSNHNSSTSRGSSHKKKDWLRKKARNPWHARYCSIIVILPVACRRHRRLPLSSSCVLPASTTSYRLSLSLSSSFLIAADLDEDDISNAPCCQQYSPRDHRLAWIHRKVPRQSTQPSRRGPSLWWATCDFPVS
jgi:hypothetical protein